MLVYGNIIKTKGTVQDSIYQSMSALFVQGLRSVHDLGKIVYFEADVPATHKQLKGLAYMSTLQMIAPFSELQRPVNSGTRLSDEAVQAIIDVCTTPPQPNHS